MGGTFDPIHHGHLVAAEEARWQFRLDEVLFVPAGQPWMKGHREVTSGEHRYRMTVLATDDDPGFSVSRMELDREGPTHTVDTLRALRSERPDADLFFITGADAILDLANWNEPEAALALATFIAATRPGYDLSALEGADGIEIIDVPALAISSSDIRMRLKEGQPVRYLVPDAVLGFIEKEHVYR